jgi:hypothetical protein
LGPPIKGVSAAILLEILTNESTPQAPRLRCVATGGFCKCRKPLHAQILQRNRAPRQYTTHVEHVAHTYVSGKTHGMMDAIVDPLRSTSNHNKIVLK